MRGVAAAISQPASNVNNLCEILNQVRTHNRGIPIHFRNPDRDQEVVEAVYRWDTRHYREIFATGFTPRPQRSDESDAVYYNLERFVNGGGTPADSSPAHGSVFVSTTRTSPRSRRQWRPRVTRNCTLYRYEIFAPGGIDAVQTLGDSNHYRNQQEISFAGGINRQYIRTALPYSVTVEPGSQFPSYRTLGNRLFRNGRFNPNPTSGGFTIQEFQDRLRNPTCPPKKWFMINLVYSTRPNYVKRAIEALGEPESEPEPKEEYYADPVCTVGHYIESAFDFLHKDEVYLFITDRCLLINYAPGTTDDYIIKAPQSIGDVFPYLNETIFASGIDAAFPAYSKDEAYIFRSDIYALINFAADGGYIIQGPKKITDSFYSLKNTIFAKGIDAAFTSSREDQAYIFRGNQYALINFAPGTTDDYIIYGPKKISEGFHCLKGTIFEHGLDAAFSCRKDEGFIFKHRKSEAYIFKGDTYALINFAPGGTDDYIIQGPKKITQSFYSLKEIIPMYPCGSGCGCGC